LVTGHNVLDTGFKEQEGLSERGRRARAEFGGVALAAGTAYGYFYDPSLSAGGVVASAAGPAFTPMAAGIAAGKGIRRGTPGLLEALQSVASSIPQVTEADMRMLPQRVVPLRAARRGLSTLGLIDE
jgi:hypothetical protein